MADRAGCQPGVSGGGTGTCQEFLEGCWCPSALPPLGCDAQGNPLWRISSDAGNGLSIGTDGGAYSTTTGTPPPGQGRKTVAALETKVFGGEQCAGLQYAFGSPAGVEHIISTQVDIIDNYSIAAADGVAMWLPYNTATNVSVYTTSPSTAAPSTLPSPTLAGLTVDAGNPYQPVSNNSAAPTADKPTGRDVNWWGWSTPTWNLKPVSQQLQEINARAVTLLRAWSAADVPATISAVALAQVAPSCIITVNPGDVSTVAQITAAGIAAGVHVDQDTTITPAAVVASGATWVGIRWSQTDARITSFVSAGLQVLVYTDSTHYQATRALTTLNARGVICQDPVYARGAVGDFRYRNPAPDWTTKGPRYGMITRDVQNNQIIDGRGYTLNGLDGVCTEAKFQWSSSTTRAVFAQLGLGELNPIPNATSYTLDMQFYVRGTQPTANFAKAGVFFGFADDRDFCVDFGQQGPAFANGYWAFVRVGSGSSNGELVIAKVTAGAYAPLVTSTTKQTWAPNSWSRLRLTVSPTALRFARLSTTGTELYSTSVNDTAFRGPYVKWAREEGDAAGEPHQLAARGWVYAPV